jgi:hypothetical protein
MEGLKYTPEQIADAKKLLDVYNGVPEEKRPILAAMMDAFISGMNAQERLTDNKAG